MATRTGSDENKTEIKQPPEENGYYVTSKQRVASRGAESIGLNTDQRMEAEERAREENEGNTADKHYRFVRRRPLLMLHALKLVHKPDKEAAPQELLDQVPAIGIAFPDGDYTTTVPYVVNRVWLQQMQQESYDKPDEEDDYDV